jgi:hypothetical protein
MGWQSKIIPITIALIYKFVDDMDAKPGVLFEGVE